MKKILLLIQLVIVCAVVNAQYNNEWIDYSKTYYKFKVGSNGIYRITQSVLASAGLGNVNAKDFQLFRNGAEVPIYTSKYAGAFSGNDYIEFYGIMNDGVPDAQLYKKDVLQMSTKFSLQTDTAAYFLTVNPGNQNKRLESTANNINGNQTPEPYFMYTLSRNYQTRINPGFALSVVDLLYSSSYETGEGYSSSPLAAGLYSEANTNLHVYNGPGTPPSSITATLAGNTYAWRNVWMSVNGINMDSIMLLQDYQVGRLANNGFPTAILSANTATVGFLHDGASPDRIVLSNYNLTYPRQFDFGGQSLFEFTLPAGAQSKYLEISNFAYGSTAPVLFDLTNNLYMTGVVNSGIAEFSLPPSATTRKLVLLNHEDASIHQVTGLTTRAFVNYANAANQGDYLIITNSILFDDGAGNDNIQNYKQYRSSVAGGGYHPVVIDIDQLVDQFAFGIKQHPLSVRNFSSYALNNFSSKPKYIYIIGKGLTYTSFRANESQPNVNKLALVPTWGDPASDNLLTASRTGATTMIPIGRLSAITGAEVGIYLNKVKEFEVAQNSPDESIAARGWMKNIAHLTGAIDDPNLFSYISNFMDGYSNTIASDSFGGNVFTFSKNISGNTAIGTNKTIDTLFKDGLSFITYFGHSSPNGLEFNLDNPNNYNNKGKYPVIMVNGCTTGNLFTYDTLRAVSKGSLSEKYIFSPDRGSVGFIGDTHSGLPFYLDRVTSVFYKNMSKTMYGKPLGDIIKATMESVYNIDTTDYASRIHAEEITLHGDPALRINPQAGPDYVISDSLVSINPQTPTLADQNITVKFNLLNIGKAISSYFNLTVVHQAPNGVNTTIANVRIPATQFKDSFSFKFPVNQLRDIGQNKLIITADANNEIPEVSESNNTVTKNFILLEDEIRPVYPYNYSIINDPQVNLLASTANPLKARIGYVMELDTTMLFNSPLKTSKAVTDSGGVIRFIPGISLTDSTVYYWRVALGPVTPDTRWLNSSFVYINGSNGGFNESQYWQFRNNSLSGITLDSNDRKLKFLDISKKLLVRTGLYPYYTWDQINVNLDDNEVDRYGCRYNSLQIIVYDPLEMKPWVNYTTVPGIPGFGRFGSASICDNTTRNFFEFPFDSPVYRKNCMDFLDMIPDGYYVSITNLGYVNTNSTFIDQWKADTALYGQNNSLYHKFLAYGLTAINNFTTNIPFSFVFKKNDAATFPVKQVTAAVNEQIAVTYFCPAKIVKGTIETPFFGPVKAWKNFKWKETTIDPLKVDINSYGIYGQDPVTGADVLISTIYNSQDTSIAFINAAVYPKLKVRINTSDDKSVTPQAIRNILLTADMLPEGGVSPNLLFKFKDVLTAADTIHLKVAFRNASNLPFDSLKVAINIADTNGNILNTYGALRVSPKGPNHIRPLAAGDTVIVNADIPCSGLNGKYMLSLEVNGDNDQPEQFHFNNLLTRSFIVSTVLPVDLLTFTGYPDGAKVVLNWRVAAEHNIVKYEMMRSGNGIDFVKIGEVNALNNGLETNYSFTDDKPARGMNFYRLKIVDLTTGSGKLSNIVPVRFDNKALQEFTVLPNPAREYFTINFKTGITGPLKAELYSTTGQLVYAESFKAENATSHMIQRPFNIAPGHYVLKITEIQNGNTSAMKLIME